MTFFGALHKSLLTLSLMSLLRSSFLYAQTGPNIDPLIDKLSYLQMKAKSGLVEQEDIQFPASEAKEQIKRLNSEGFEGHATWVENRILRPLEQIDSSSDQYSKKCLEDKKDEDPYSLNGPRGLKKSELSKAFQSYFHGQIPVSCSGEFNQDVVGEIEQWSEGQIQILKQLDNKIILLEENTKKLSTKDKIDHLDQEIEKYLSNSDFARKSIDDMAETFYVNISAGLTKNLLEMQNRYLENPRKKISHKQNGAKPLLAEKDSDIYQRLTGRKIKAQAFKLVSRLKKDVPDFEQRHVLYTALRGTSKEQVSFMQKAVDKIPEPKRFESLKKILELPLKGSFEFLDESISLLENGQNLSPEEAQDVWQKMRNLSISTGEKEEYEYQETALKLIEQQASTSKERISLLQNLYEKQFTNDQLELINKAQEIESAPREKLALLNLVLDSKKESSALTSIDHTLPIITGALAVNITAKDREQNLGDAEIALSIDLNALKESTNRLSLLHKQREGLSRFSRRLASASKGLSQDSTNSSIAEGLELLEQTSSPLQSESYFHRRFFAYKKEPTSIMDPLKGTESPGFKVFVDPETNEIKISTALAEPAVSFSKEKKQH